MKSLHIVRSSGLLPFVKFLDNIGCPVNRLLEQHKLRRDLIFNPNGYLPEYQRWLFIEQAARLEGLKTLGGLVSLNCSVEDHGLLTQIAIQQPTLEKSLQIFCFLIGKHQTRLKNKIHFTIKPPIATVSFPKYNVVDFSGHDLGEQTLLFGIFKIIQKYLGKKDKLCEFYFPDIKKLNYWRSSSLFDEQKWHLSNSCYAITFPSNLVYTSCFTKKLEIPQSDVESWVSSQPPESFTAKINLLMPSFVEQGIIKITDISDLIGIGERTLRRRLENSGTSYRKILQQNLLEISQQKLLNSNDSIAEISFKLGYEYPEHFSRAFKLWTGTSPSKFRLNNATVTH